MTPDNTPTDNGYLCSAASAAASAAAAATRRHSLLCKNRMKERLAVRF